MASSAVSWEARVGGHGCPLDAPRPASNDQWDLVETLSISSLYLTRNQTYRGQCQLVFDPRHVARLDELSVREWTMLAIDLHTAERAIMRVVRPDHVNVESLGNVVPHLHFHIIPRYKQDPRWGMPVWQTPLEVMPDTRLDDDERRSLLEELRRALRGPVTTMTGVGLTSRWVAANRALETESPGPLYRDVHARELAGDAGFDMLHTMRSVGGMAGFSGPDPFLTIRTRFLDDGLLAATRGGHLRQVVLLAAGMDARAFRLDWPAGVTLFEIDRDDVFDHKETTLVRLGARPSCDRRIVRQDLAQPWTGALCEAGFDPHAPAAFLAEGLLYYLAPEEVRTFFAALGDVAAPGSWLGLDALSPEVLTSPFMAGYVQKLSDLGCPWRFGLADPEAFLAEHGWTGTYTLPGEPDAHYGRWILPTFPRAMRNVTRLYLIRATRNG